MGSAPAPIQAREPSGGTERWEVMAVAMLLRGRSPNRLSCRPSAGLQPRQQGESDSSQVSVTSCRARQRIAAQHHTPRPPQRCPGAAAADINCVFPVVKGCSVSNTDPVRSHLHSLLRTRQANQGFLPETKSPTAGARSVRGACAGSNITAVE